MCAALGAWWTLEPSVYPLGAAESEPPDGLVELVPEALAAPGFLVAGLLGTVVAVLLGAAGPNTQGRRALLTAGTAYAVIFGILVPDFQLLAFLGYALALSGPVVIVALLVSGARRHPRNLIGLGLVGAAVVLGVLAGEIGEPTAQMFRSIREGFERVGPRPLVLAVMVAGGVLFGALAVAARRGRPAGSTPESQARLQRWGRAATWAAALCPMPYVLIRATWLTPWPLAAPGGSDALGGGIRVFGLLLGLAALCGAVLTLGLISRWGEVFPAWLPVLRGRPVPVLAAVVPGGLVSTVLCASAVSMVILAVGTGKVWLLAFIPAPLWGPSLGLATYAYYRRRTDRPRVS